MTPDRPSRETLRCPLGAHIEHPFARLAGFPGLTTGQALAIMGDRPWLAAPRRMSARGKLLHRQPCFRVSRQGAEAGGSTIQLRAGQLWFRHHSNAAHRPRQPVKGIQQGAVGLRDTEISSETSMKEKLSACTRVGNVIHEAQPGGQEPGKAVRHHRLSRLRFDDRQTSDY